MTTSELIEFAVLDALALLDEQEQAEFDTAFRSAPPGVQAQVRREQTRFCSLNDLLPDVQPPAELRALVIERVRAVMHSPALSDPQGPVALSFGKRRVSPLWRAAALATAAAAFVFAAGTMHMRAAFDNLRDDLGDIYTAENLLRSFGTKFQDTMFNPNIRHVVFSPANEQVRAEAVLMLDPETGEAFLLCKDLPASQTGSYRLVVMDALDADAPAEHVAGFSSRGQFISRPVKVQSSTSCRFAIVPATSDGSALTDQPLLMTEPITIESL